MRSIASICCLRGFKVKCSNSRSEESFKFSSFVKLYPKCSHLNTINLKLVSVRTVHSRKNFYGTQIILFHLGLLSALTLGAFQRDCGLQEAQIFLKCELNSNFNISPKLSKYLSPN